MRQDEPYNNQKRIIKSEVDAQFALDRLLQGDDLRNLENGIYTFLIKLDNPRVNTLFDSYPDLLQEYGLEDTPTGNIQIDGNSPNEMKTAGLLSCLQVILSLSADLKAHPDGDGLQLEALRYILKSIGCGDFVREILLMVIGVTGEDYYRSFRDKTDTLGADLEQLNSFTEDPELQEHLDLMTWFCIVRIFLESVYMHYYTIY